MKNWQFDQYVRNYKDRDELISQIETEIIELYEDVSPVLTGYNIDSITKHSIAVETYAFHIIERKEELNFKRQRINQQHEVVLKMLNTLTNDEKEEFERLYPFKFKQRSKFKPLLEQFVDEVIKTPYNEDMTSYEHDLLMLSVDEYDKAVESMDDAELFSDYYDLDGTLDAQIAERNQRINEMKNPCFTRSAPAS